MRRLTWLGFVLALSWLGLGLAYGTGAEFYLETIRIEGAGTVSRGIILAESRLEEGKTYDEGELANAIHRINRLPFVRDAEFSLEKGSIRGQYVLVIHLKGIRPYFFDGLHENIRIDDDREDLSHLVLGGRFFLGAYTEIYGAVQPGPYFLSDSLQTKNRYALGIAHYNLFNRHIFANIEYGRYEFDGDFFIFTPNQSRDESKQDTWTAQLNVPLRGDQWIKTAIQSHHIESDFYLDFQAPGIDILRGDHEDGDVWTAKTFWEANTINDNFLPTAGRLYQAGVAYANLRSDRVTFDQDVENGAQRHYREDIHQLNLFAAWDQYWQLARNQAVFFNALGVVLGNSLLPDDEPDGMTNTEPDPDGTYTIGDIFDNEFKAYLDLSLGYSVGLWSRKHSRRFGDLRFELKASKRFGDDLTFPEGTSVDVDRPITSFNLVPGSRDFLFADREDTSYEAHLKYRNSWGIFRVGLKVLD